MKIAASLGTSTKMEPSISLCRLTAYHIKNLVDNGLAPYPNPAPTNRRRTMSDFKPFDRVLVRDSDDAAWVPGFYSHASGRIDVPYTSILSHSYAQCIPYEGNEHLAGTTASPSSQAQYRFMPDCGELVAVRNSDMSGWVPRIAVGLDGDGRYLCRKLPCTNGSELGSWEHARAWDDELVAVVPIPDEPREPK